MSSSELNEKNFIPYNTSIFSPENDSVEEHKRIERENAEKKKKKDKVKSELLPKNPSLEEEEKISPLEEYNSTTSEEGSVSLKDTVDSVEGEVEGPVELEDEEGERRQGISNMLTDLKVNYDNLNNNIHCRDIFLSLFKNSCDYLLEGLKKGNTTEDVIKNVKMMNIEKKIDNYDIFINALECISLMYHEHMKSIGFPMGRNERIMNQIKNTKYHQFQKYIKIRNMKYALDDCIFNSRNMIPS